MGEGVSTPGDFQSPADALEIVCCGASTSSALTLAEDSWPTLPLPQPSISSQLSRDTPSGWKAVTRNVPPPSHGSAL